MVWNFQAVDNGHQSFQTNLNLVWNLHLAKSMFSFPNQTGNGLGNPTYFWGLTFPNQTGFGLEKDTE